MDGNRGDDLNDRMREERLREERLRASGLDRSGVPDSNATSESLVADSMRTGAPRGDVVDVDRDAADMRRDDINPGDEIGEAVGGISGVLTGAALGSLGGPIGTIIGGIAGAVSGWWAGRAISEAASHATSDDDEYYRTHFDSAAGGRAARTYDDVRPAYQLGHIAGRNPDYQARSFDEVERDLRHGWSTDVSERHGPWDEVRDYARHAYERGRSTTSGTAGMAGNVGQRVGNALDDTKDRLDANPASRPGLDSTDSAHRATGAGPLDRAADTLGNAGHRTANVLDDVKDRVDGNPASRPGVDRTDDPDRRF